MSAPFLRDAPVPDASTRVIAPSAADLLSRGLGFDFRRTRIHADHEAAVLADRFDAAAVTRGADIYVGSSVTAATWPQVLAHEAAHVAQQSQGPIGYQARPRARTRSGTIRVTWTDDSGDFYHRVVEAVAAKFGVDESGLWQNFHAPVHRLHRQLATGEHQRRVRLDVSFFYDPDDVPGASNVTLALHAPAAPSKETAQPATTEPAAPDPDLTPPSGETEEQRAARNLRLTAKLLADTVDAADREGFDGVDYVVENNGRETSSASMAKIGKSGARPRGAARVSRAAVYKSVHSFLSLMSDRTNWRMSFQYRRDADGVMQFSKLETRDVTVPEVATGGGRSEADELRALGIPDRKEIYRKIFEDAEKELKDAGIMIASFGLEQLVLWIVGGLFLRALGMLGKAAGKKAFPYLRRALGQKRKKDIAKAISTLGDAEAAELSALMKQFEKGGLDEAATTRMGELMAKVESSLGGSVPGLRVVGRMKEHSSLVKAAESLGEVTQREADDLVERYLAGNTNPGIGTKHLADDIYYLRGRNGARVFYRENADGYMEILGKADKGNEDQVIAAVLRYFGSP